MSPTDSYRKQHDELLAVAGEFKSHLRANNLEQDSAPARTLLSQLLGKLTIHLAMEDRSLYPRLSEHDDARVRDTANRFQSEMGHISKTLEAYNKKWATPAAIQANADAFIAETDGVLKALADRISRENDDLYKLLDNLA